MMARKGLLVGIWLALSGAACAGSNAPAWQKADTLLEEVNNKGASAVIRSLWGKPAWYSVTEKIASGESAWIDVALALRKGSDAGATSELHSAMFLALGKNPAYVLRTAEPQFKLSEICEGRVDPPSTYQEALAELTRARSAVERVQASELQSKKELCLAKLREGEEHLKRQFNVTGR
jgi:hypothetical protein